MTELTDILIVFLFYANRIVITLGTVVLPRMWTSGIRRRK